MNDYFAELYIAGSIANAGWNVYFPHRDQGFDFIVSKFIDNKRWVVRPVQVKSKTPRAEATRASYGFKGKLSAVRPEMVLAIPYFTSAATGKPCCIAYMPFSWITRDSRGFHCQPAILKASLVRPRPSLIRYFDEGGIKLMEAADWSVS